MSYRFLFTAKLVNCRIKQVVLVLLHFWSLVWCLGQRDVDCTVKLLSGLDFILPSWGNENGRHIDHYHFVGVLCPLKWLGEGS
jgi:hypothetical protein